MKARLRAWIEVLGNQFWLRPSLLVALGVALGEVAVWSEGRRVAGDAGLLGAWIYSGGEAGARALLGAIASSTIGVAGTTFSITVAALSLASGQMGPRLLRNFVRDGGNQVALGIFLGTFSYALIVLRTVRTVEETEFIPHLGVTGAVGLALLCVATLIWFVHHVALSINVETVVDAVFEDLSDAVDMLTSEKDDSTPLMEIEPGIPVGLGCGGYIQTFDQDALADWAVAQDVRVAMRARPGVYVPAGAIIAEVSRPHPEAAAILTKSLTFGSKRTAVQDLEFSVRQLVEVAVRALSPGINDPFTAATVLDRLGAVLCRLTQRHLRGGAVTRDGRTVLTYPATSYDGLCDVMFHTIRQNAAHSAFVLIRLLDVLTRVAEIERSAQRLATLRRHADLALSAGRDGLTDAAGRPDLEARYRGFVACEPTISSPGAMRSGPHEQVCSLVPRQRP